MHQKTSKVESNSFAKDMGTSLKMQSHKSSSCSAENLDMVIKETRTPIFALKRLNYSTQSKGNRTHLLSFGTRVFLLEMHVKCFVESFHTKLEIDSGTPPSQWSNCRVVPPWASCQCTLSWNNMWEQHIYPTI